MYVSFCFCLEFITNQYLYGLKKNVCEFVVLALERFSNVTIDIHFLKCHRTMNWYVGEVYSHYRSNQRMRCYYCHYSEMFSTLYPYADNIDIKFKFLISVCPLSFLKVPSLPRELTCHIPETCTAINCCLSVDFLDMTFNTFINIDTCNYILSGCVEKLCFNVTLFDYHWGRSYNVIWTGTWIYDILPWRGVTGKLQDMK